MKYVELKVTEYQVFEVDDDFNYEDIGDAYETGKLLMDKPDVFYLDAQIVDDKKKLNGNYVSIL